MRFSMLGRLGATVWLLYPLMLFALPKVDIGPLAPNTVFALLFFATAAAVLLFAAPAQNVIDLVRRIPLPAFLFAVSIVGLLYVKAGPVDALRAVTWLVVFVVSFFAFGEDRRFENLLRLWFWMAAVASVVIIVLHGFPFPKEIDFLSWKHRTVLGYFLSVGVLAGIVLYRGRHVSWRAAHLTGLVCVVAGLAGTLARGPWLLTLVALFMLDARARRGAALALVSVGALAAVLFPAALVGDVSQRFQSIYDWNVGSSSLYRLNLYKAVVDAIPDVWLSGASTTAYGPVLAAHAGIRYAAFFIPGFETDSDLINLMLLGGLPLTLLALWMFVDAARRGARDTSSAPDIRGMRRAVLAAVLMQMCLDNILSNALGWFLLGVALHSNPRRSANV